MSLEMVDAVGKQLLLNTLKHVDSHNKAVEEQLMWKSLHADARMRKDSKSSSFRSDESHSRRKDKEKDEYSSRRSRRRREEKRHPRESYRPSSSSGRGEREKSSGSGSGSSSQTNFWLRKLAECKEADPDKWHHDGFRELYPNELEKREPSIVSELRTYEKSTGTSSNSKKPRRSESKERSRSRRTDGKHVNSPEEEDP